MLDYIKLDHVGPSPQMLLEFGPRLNLLTGDNGLGKTFALDMAWWALTRTWPGDNQTRPADKQAWPRREKGKPCIKYRLTAKSGKTDALESTYDRKSQSWKPPRGRPPMPGLVIYARIDGGFSVWDPARNYWRKLSARDYEQAERPSAFQFTNHDLWQGLKHEGTDLCNGLLRDWISWQYRRRDLFDVFSQVLAGLSPPGEREALEPGEPTRLSIVDAKELPTLKLPYDQALPVTLVSAGVRRILGLAYMLVWAWSEHQTAAAGLQQRPTDRMVLLLDEVEAHLHPQWQRALLPAILRVIQRLCPGTALQHVQLIGTTHAPLVLASVETVFDPELDRLITFVLQDDSVQVQKPTWAKQGDVINWLVSSVFDLKQARSLEAERAIDTARRSCEETGRGCPPSS